MLYGALSIMQTDALHTAFDNFLIHISLQLFHVKNLRTKTYFCR